MIEGDQATVNDAERIRATGARVIQINTGTGCHLEANMLARGLQQLSPPSGSILMIENVGNLVCPALFHLGERAKVVILSVTEGEDKPIKYPHMFRASRLMLLNKIDLLPHLRFDVERCIAYARRVNPQIEVRASGLGRIGRRHGEGTHAQSPHRHSHPERLPLRALTIGVMHGLAGSAALVVLSLQSAPSVALGLGHVALFGVGSILGMAVLSVAIAVPLRVSARHLTRLHVAMSALASPAAWACSWWPTSAT